MLQHISGIMDSRYYNDLVNESLDYFSANENLSLYYQWCLAYKRTWSESFAFWCDNQQNLTHQRITQKWKEMALRFRSRDLNDTIKQAEIRKQERLEKENNPEQSKFVKRSKIRVDENGLPY